MFVIRECTPDLWSHAAACFSFGQRVLCRQKNR
jgi:hypothetical protein